MPVRWNSCAVLALVLLFHGAKATTTCNSNVCTCVAFQPLSRSLSCNHECSTEDVTVYWNLYRQENNYNITFWFDGTEPRHVSYTTASVATIVRQMRATEDGQLVIDKINLHIHQADYTCWAQLSDGTQCGVSDSFHLSVVSLFTDLTEKPKVLDTSGSAIFGSPGVLCIRGATPGLNQDSTTWEKDDVTTAIAQNISDECPMCTECTPEVFLSLPSVQERLMAGYSHSSFVISTSSEVVGDRDYSECLTIKNRYISFLVIMEVKEEDVGVWTLTVVSAHNAANTGAYNLGASYRQIETSVEELKNTRLISEENGYAVCNATYSINFDASLHWKIQHTEKLVFSTNHTIVAEDGAIVAEGEESLAFSPVDLSAQLLSDLCQEFGFQVDEENVAFSVNYAPHQLLQFNSEEHDEARVQRQFLVLVMCNVGRDQIGTYTCIASDNGISGRHEQSMDVSVFVRERDEDTTTNKTNGSDITVNKTDGNEMNGDSTTNTTSGIKLDAVSVSVVVIVTISNIIINSIL